MKSEKFKTEITDVTVYGNPEGIVKSTKIRYTDVRLTWELTFELKDWGVKSVHIMLKQIILNCETCFFGDGVYNLNQFKIDCLDWSEKIMNAPFVDGQIKPQSIVIDYRTNKIELTF